ncbi:RlpA-like double-psi beta-barrel-protein domain-containing protein-containing protein [Podospora didyma]|uniref:Cellulase n=1 Tax=Podospora didyma TaxID=330526 RepID=A0AAE0NGJ7_9PEZI|nr:RlpA-like double-psi beta-barrel-protein domain-containing protein-containing protein [Podospora didyma]
MGSSTLLRAALAVLLQVAAHAASGSGQSTRYWDCCKPSCSWPGKASVNRPVFACDKINNHLSDFSAASECNKGSAFACADYGGSEASWCCGCYALTFTSGPVAGKTMVVQSTSTGADLGNNHFDLAMPGGGVGLFDGCSSQFGGIGGIGGAQYGGISSRTLCLSMASALQPGCNWRFDWFQNADNPSFTFTQVQCPAELVARKGCRRSEDSKFPVFSAPASGGGGNTVAPTSTTTAKAPASTGSICNIQKWEQCSGMGWAGCTNCAAGLTCKFINEYYSQCTPVG